jgi:hypothetical protein
MTKPRPVEIVLEGAQAEAATRDLFSLGWFEAEWERTPEASTPIVRARLIALAGGSVTVADKLLGWWEKWHMPDGDPGARLSVRVEGHGARLSLDSATRDALVDVLRVLHAPAR